MSSFSSHRKRPQPERFGPTRSAMATLRPPRTSGTPQDVVSVAGAAVCGMLENGVRTAYAVIDEYLLRGQEAARGRFNDSNRRGFMTDDRGNFGGGRGPNVGFGPGGVFGQSTFGTLNPTVMMTQWIAAMQAWSQFWFACVQAPMQPFSGMQQAPQSSMASSVQLESVTLGVSSQGQVESTVNLTPGNDLQGLTCDPLRLDGNPGTYIAAPTISYYQPGTLRVTINIPAKQSVGCYRGLIRRQPDQCAVGNVTVVIPTIV
jgi:hypothetical protein